MGKSKFSAALGVFLFLGTVVGAPSLAGAESYSSPDKRVTLRFNLDARGAPTYAADFDGKPLLLDSPLGLRLRGASLATGFRLREVRHESRDSTYSLPLGKARHARDHFEGYSFFLEEKGAPHRTLEVDFRLYDDGFGFRYNLPEQPSLRDFVIEEELTGFRLPGDPRVFAVELPFNTSFEGYFSHKPLSRYVPGKTMTLPALLLQPGGPAIGLTEAALSDYAGLYLTRGGGRGQLQARLAPSLTEPSVKVKGRAPFASPWRVVLAGKTPGELLESNLVNNLNEPTALADTSWIHPGKIVFPWWNDYRLDVDPADRDPSHRPGLTTWALKKYVDFCAANGIEYFSFDGFDQAWYGGDIGNPPPGTDVTKAIPQIDMPEVLRYGLSRGIRARLWMHVLALQQAPDLDAVFALYESWGVQGVMLDFLNHDDQETVRFHTRVIRAAARHHLTVNFHGIWKPTGLSRTYPNLLSHEGVMSSEYNRFVNVRDASGVVDNGRQSYGSPPEHEMLYAWVRQLAGPTDVHPGSFNPVLPERFDPSKDQLRAMGTLARQLAFYVVVESGMQMVVDAPKEYLTRPGPFAFVREVPVVWDETRVLGGEVGQSIVMARRSGRDWYLGAMTDRRARTFTLPLDFLGEGNFEAEMFTDGRSARPDDVAIHRQAVHRGDSLRLELAPSGGLAARIRATPAPSP